MVAVVAAAAVAAAGVAFAAIWVGLSHWERFETPIGEQRAIQLAEGSIVNLNAQSLLQVRFSDSKRDIRLLRGEAMFKVAPDRVRPFRVHTPSAVVQAVGTQFNVYARPDGTTTVAVLEGRVQVSADGTAAAKRSAAPAALAAGEEARIEATGNVERRANANVADAVAWQQRKLVFKRTALEDIVMEFNRYNKSLQIRLDGVEPGSLRFTGAFDADDPLSLAALLARESDLAVQRRDKEIVIRAR